VEVFGKYCGSGIVKNQGRGKFGAGQSGDLVAEFDCGQRVKPGILKHP
jgi:hypothetical protein